MKLNTSKKKSERERERERPISVLFGRERQTLVFWSAKEADEVF